ncbi:MAG TPA: hypothetical protein VF884_03985 [Nitrososphaeraceae archaeon]
MTEKRTIMNCPCCGNNEMQLNSIAGYGSYMLDDAYMHVMTSELLTSQGGDNKG